MDINISTNGTLILEDIKARHSFEKYKSQSPISDKAILWCTKVAQVFKYI